MKRNSSANTSGQANVAAPMFLRMPSVIRMTGLGRSTIYRLIADQKFPRPVKLGPRAVAWRSTDLDFWSAARPVSSQ